MKSLLSILFCLSSFYSAAQVLELSIKSLTTLDKTQLNPSLGERAGGLSAMEYRADTDQWLVVADREKVAKTSTFFNLKLTDGDINQAFGDFRKLPDVQNVESIRYHPDQQGFYFAMEEDEESKIAFWKEGRKPEVVFAESRPGMYLTTNRGIEGIAIMPNNDLWFAFESGGSVACGKDNYTVFRKATYRRGRRQQYNFNRKKKKDYRYEMDRCACMDSTQAFTSTLGNGISEILALDNQHLLVLERCYDGRQNGCQVKLFLATINKKQAIIEKSKMLFDFNDPTYMPAIKTGWLPDNLEGMTWGPVENGKKTLYLVSDDNFRANQRTQLIVFEVNTSKI